MSKTGFFHHRFILPQEHGSWIWWIGPFILGVAAAGQWTQNLLMLFIAMLAAFLIRQPLTILVKVQSGRRDQRDRLPALLWSAIYALIAGVAFILLLISGFFELFWLLLPGIPVFLWHLALISRRAERGQRGIEIVGAGVLALAAPASFWVAGGSPRILAWSLWVITWLQSAASIVLVYQRLSERRRTDPGSYVVRFKRATRSLAYHVFNLIAILLIRSLVGLPWLAPLASSLMLLDAIDSLRAPALGWKPARIGLRQLTASSLFVILISLGFILDL
jgi:hypothetical protein